MIIFEDENFRLESWHNGLSYNLTYLLEHVEYFCQGEDALDFEQERANAEKAFPRLTDGGILAWLWCTYYADAAQPCA